MPSQAALPILIDRFADRPWVRLTTVSAGVAGLALLAQVSFYLPWTVVPITGQTFGVALIALTAGRKYATSILLAYLALGWLGFPLFANATGGFVFGPTLGYLLGMFLAASVVGWTADRGWSRSFPNALLAACVGSLIIFASGLFGLSYFVPSEALFGAGLYPFLIWDLIKNLLAAALAAGIRRSLDSKEPNK